MTTNKLKSRRCDIGRYYNGDIDGKFWFGVQPSDAADRFGVTGSTPNYLSYYFTENDLHEVENEVKAIENILGNYKIAFDEFFKSVTGYNDETLKEHNLLDAWNKHSSDYADLRLGIKIRDCIKEHGECSFEAEC